MLRLTPTNLNKADRYLEQKFTINCMNGINTWLLNGTNNIKQMLFQF